MGGRKGVLLFVDMCENSNTMLRKIPSLRCLLLKNAVSIAVEIMCMFS